MHIVEGPSFPGCGWPNYFGLCPMCRRAETAEALVAELEKALGEALMNPRYLSIGSINNVVQLRRLNLEKYDSLLALAALGDGA